MSDPRLAVRARSYVAVCMVLAVATTASGLIVRTTDPVRGAVFFVLTAAFVVQAFFWASKERGAAKQSTTTAVKPGDHEHPKNPRRSAAWIGVAASYLFVVSLIASRLPGPVGPLVFAAALLFALAAQRFVRDFWN